LFLGNQIELSETVRAQAGNKGREAVHVAEAEVSSIPEVSIPEVSSIPEAAAPNVVGSEVTKRVSSSPIQGVGSLLGISSAESAEAADDISLEVDEIFLRAIDIRL
jgi:hypothetical protein